MGLLDDAIREHLDLKRRHGADPVEIDRAEHEALGPVRRGSDEPDQSMFDRDPADEQELAYDHEEERDWEQSFEDEEEFEPARPSQGLEHEAPSAQEPAEPWAPEDSFAEEEPTGSEDVPPPHPAHRSESVGAETVEYELEDFPEREDDDVLEETPEFLQDTPDHDRLWFEQRPPRDFDFDK
jgi:hypothetical protein